MRILTQAMFVLVLAMLGWVGTVQAAIQVMGTRVIYPAGQREVSVNLVNNNNGGPRLVQVWVDSGNSGETAETAQAPFLVTPPVFRVDPGKGQALRLMYNGAALPQDRESVFWLNVMEVPPRATGEEGQNLLQFAVRHRLKIFYRPGDLEGKSTEAYQQLRWRVVPDGEGRMLECTNPSPFNVSFTGAQDIGSDSRAPIIAGGMCPAKGLQVFPLEGRLPTSGRMTLNVVNDYGGIDPRELIF